MHPAWLWAEEMEKGAYYRALLIDMVFRVKSLTRVFHGNETSQEI